MPISVAGLAAKMNMRLLMGSLIILEGVALLFPRYLKTDSLRLVAFGFAWFLIVTAPYAIFADRLFMRYGYLGHAGLALCVGGLVESIVRLLSTRRSAALPQVAAPSHA